MYCAACPGPGCGRTEQHGVQLSLLRLLVAVSGPDRFSLQAGYGLWAVLSPPQLSSIADTLAQEAGGPASLYQISQMQFEKHLLLLPEMF